MSERFLSMVMCVGLCVTALARAEALPVPSGDAAGQALLDSPRHGEWADVPMGEGQPPVRTWVVYPERADAAPVVIVVHEIFGLTDWIRSVADALAAAGYIAVAPDLLSGRGPDGKGTEGFEGDAVRAAVRGLADDEVVARLNAVRDYALKLPAAAKRSAVIGFCWGGSTAFTYAGAQGELEASVVYYGTGPQDVEVARRIACPVLGLYGEDDARVTATVPATTQAMADAGRRFEPITYARAGHGFLRQQDGREGANAAAATQAWAATLTFLKAHLEPKPD